MVSKLRTGRTRELGLFVLASLAMGMACSIVDATFNNFLNDRFALGGFARSFLEFPRELPGLMVAFVSALLWFLCSRRLSALAMILGAAGALLMGFASPTYGIMVLWLFIYSLGQHIFLPLSSSIGMELAEEGKAGQRLGQLNAVRNFAAITGSFLVFLGFRHLGFTFHHTFALSALAFGLAALFLFLMKKDRTQPASLHLRLHREYGLYYVLSILYGSRKQLFLTFAPWVLVTVFHQPTQTIATLLTLGGVIGIIFQPFLGWAIDRLGERFVLASEAVLLVFVCSGYGFSGSLLNERAAFLVACACFILDQMLMSVNMARSTYIKKIAQDPSHVQPALTLSVSIDHVFSISVALLGGLIWNTAGFQYVFLLGAAIALLNFVAALKVRVPAQERALHARMPAEDGGPARKTGSG
ncbi:MAG TPA: MFS transporter [Deltaproteobacteria bacterium]|jgi:predicted MFS family arabinose efflux permease|nr:MFS transporter [Deltaproteobacteria bacterium]HOI07700.1 MFS transporter [Deltaproteobacteria bacterium]